MSYKQITLFLVQVTKRNMANRMKMWQTLTFLYIFVHFGCAF